MEINNISEKLQKQQQLPIFEHKQKIINIIKENDFCVITGDTGSGKSTQLPQYIVDSEEIKANIIQKELLKDDKIKVVITQPRRMAAISMAKRICYERSCRLREEVGYTIRFDDQSSDQTIIKYVTDGILVRECLQDQLLSKYNVVILDEAHERSLFTDILFALVKIAVKQRKGGLKMIVTSATLNCDQFQSYFEKCPILSMQGRCYPVDIKYAPSVANKRVEESVKSAIRMHLHEGPGDILVFLPGSEECEQAAKLCLLKLEELVNKGKEVPGMVIFALYGSQDSDDQAKVFEQQDPNIRKLIFSTNIAETSITIDNIGFVIDCGYVKQKCFNPKTGMDALIVVPISKVQAIQRAGRAGRTQAGKCYRMYSEMFYLDQMLEHTIPEILRVNLSNTILTLKSMKINDVVHFEYMEKPDQDAIYQALKQLYLLDALNEDGFISDVGEEMSRFPLEPSFAKALMASKVMNCEDDMLTVLNELIDKLAALLSTENIWQKIPRAKEAEFTKFERKQFEFIDMDGDHHTYLKIYKQWVKHRYSTEWCRFNFLNVRALKQAENIKTQLRDILNSCDYQQYKNYFKDDSLYIQYKEIKRIHQKDALRMALTTGFYFNSARKMVNSERDYLLLSEGNIVSIDQASIFSLKEQFPDYVIYTELSGTSMARGMMRMVSLIDQNWIKEKVHTMKTVDIVRLAGEEKKIIQIEKLESNDSKELLLQKRKQADQKLEDAKLRYLARKKLKQ